MQFARRWRVAWGIAIFSLTFAAVLAPLAGAKSHSATHPLIATPFQGTITSDVYVRRGPTQHDTIVSTARAGVAFTVYAQVPGQLLWGGNTWDRISPLSASPQYVYAGLVRFGVSGGPPAPAAKASTGKLILISLSRQWLWAYQDGAPVFSAPVTTARPGLVTPTGVFTIFSHLHPTVFYSPWPPGSPYYYPPTYINYAMAWLQGGFFLHDASWRSAYGPGTNDWHYDPIDGWQYGTHGCITAPLQAIIWLYHWAPNGTTLEVDG